MNHTAARSWDSKPQGERRQVCQTGRSAGSKVHLAGTAPRQRWCVLGTVLPVHWVPRCRSLRNASVFYFTVFSKLLLKVKC